MPSPGYAFKRLAPALVAVTLGCNQGDARSSTDSSTVGTSGIPLGEERRTQQAAGTGAVRTATVPSDPCAWITVAEVEAVTGKKLIGPPEQADADCRYPVALDSATLELKTRMREATRRFLGHDAPELRDSSWNRGAIIVSVDLTAGGADVRRAAADDSAAAAWIASKGKPRAADAGARVEPGPNVSEGWDLARKLFGNFHGQIGHIRVTVEENSSAIDKVISFERKAALAARVRDRIPDLPFANPNGDVSGYMPRAPDPCTLLTRSEVEAVLGPLVVEPYRIGETEPLAESSGRSCGYFTKNHHVLVVTPYWSDGKSALASARWVGKLVSMIAPDPDAEAADTLEGPWDEAATELDGSVAFLTGDRLLRVSYGMSSIDAAQAVRLARTAVERLAATPPR
jgi:hypothetical protein